ncbi:hypothetical protein EYF80_020098 [Liparis tanakae]|uniref:Uncharacterized protein n=1 Tax=Liparis tanakae TaxID=230148 RepID=A0A4Z2HXH4_9TELE|nr:hypothetical protein EYF80_020098 [Liparis tanakae]
MPAKGKPESLRVTQGTTTGSAAGSSGRPAPDGSCLTFNHTCFARQLGLRDIQWGNSRNLIRVILESQSPLVIISALHLVHGEVGPLQVLLLSVKFALAQPAGAADLGGLLLVVGVVRVLEVLGHGRVSGHAAGLAVPVTEHMFLGAVVPLEGALAATQEYEEQYGRHAQQGHSPYNAPDDGTCIGLLRRDLAAPNERVVREFWVGKDRWKGVCQCSGGRRRDEVRKTRTVKAKGKGRTPGPQPQKSPPKHWKALPINSGMQFQTWNNTTQEENDWRDSTGIVFVSVH